MVWVFDTDSFCNKEKNRETNSLFKVDENNKMWLRFGDDYIVQVFCCNNVTFGVEVMWQLPTTASPHPVWLPSTLGFSSNYATA